MDGLSLAQRLLRGYQEVEGSVTQDHTASYAQYLVHRVYDYNTHTQLSLSCHPYIDIYLYRYTHTQNVLLVLCNNQVICHT